MRYLIDTHWVASFLNGRQEARTLFEALSLEESAISLITYGEIYDGIYYGQNPQLAERGFRQLLRALPVLPLNRAMLRRFGYIRGDLRRRGELIGDPDILIAATALHHNLTLVTGNVRHFERIAGLSLYQ
jgi:tRNA(fMet)-specific endonuclease VapC